jgi:hypothetical protein
MNKRSWWALPNFHSNHPENDPLPPTVKHNPSKTEDKEKLVS